MWIKKALKKVSGNYSDFKSGLSIIFGKPEPGKGDRKLAKMSMIVMGEIPSYGKVAVRSQVIKGIEGDLKRAVKKGGKVEVEALIKNAFNTPEYVRLLYKLGLAEPEVRVLGIQALKGAKVRRCK